MDGTIKQNHRRFLQGILFPACAFLFFVNVLVFCSFYLLSDYQHLVAWYLNLNNCFYDNEHWSTGFFTPGIKSDGNIYCIIALAIASAGLLYISKRIKSWNKPETLHNTVKWEAGNLLPIITALIIAVILWFWGNNMVFPAYDEVFSVQNSAELHPFQTISYYVKPNNHLFFNLLNGVIFHSFADKVATGRIISLLAYYALILSLFFWFKSLVQNRWVALLISITLGLQFPVWGFSFQARGYELYLLAEWGMYISLFAWLRSHGRHWLYVNTICCAIGYFCLPTFLYFHAAQLVFMAICQLLYKKQAASFWKFQLAGIMITYILYLPALCFSGLDAIIHNHYTSPMADKSVIAYAEWIFPDAKIYLARIFSDVHWNNLSFNLVLLLLPLSLLFSKKNEMNFLFGLFFLLMWIVLFIIILVMKALPFERNLIGQFSITLAGVIMVGNWVAGLYARKGKTNIAKWIIFCTVPLLFAIHFMRTNKENSKKRLYGYDVNTTYREISEVINYIPQGSTVAISDDVFFCGYILRENGYKLNKCITGNEDYIIKMDYEKLSKQIAEKYFLIMTTKRFYEVYRRK